MFRHSAVILSVAIGLPLMTGACGIPMAVTAGSYAADGGLALTTNKTATDHFMSMVSEQDCSMWRIFRHQVVCKDRPPGSKDPYDVNYDEPFREQSEGGGIQYAPPLRATADAPAMSWDAAAYKTAPPQPETQPTSAVAETPPAVEPAPAPAAMPAPHAAPKKKAVRHVKAKPRKPTPGQVASAR